MTHKGPITNHEFKDVQLENQHLSSLANQIVQLHEDFEDMTRNREEAKKQLEAKFQDVHRKIQNTRELLVQENSRIENTLVAYQSKFDTLKQDTINRVDKQYTDYFNETSQQFQEANSQYEALVKSLAEQKIQRIKESDEAFSEIRRQLETLFNNYNLEKKTRIEKEKEINSRLSDELFKLTQNLDAENTQRILNHDELRKWTENTLKTQTKTTQARHTKTVDEFTHIAHSLETEINTRYEHQNQIIDNISKVTTTLQNTLKVIGKN